MLVKYIMLAHPCNWGVQRWEILVTGKSMKRKSKVQRCFQICAQSLEKLIGTILSKSSSANQHHVVVGAGTFGCDRTAEFC